MKFILQTPFLVEKEIQKNFEILFFCVTKLFVSPVLRTEHAGAECAKDLHDVYEYLHWPWTRIHKMFMNTRTGLV